jgi:predicted O-methyltransferase YrrM
MKKALKNIRAFVRRQLGISTVIQNQERILSELSQLNRKEDELLKGMVFNNSIIGSDWLKKPNFSPGGWAVDYAFLYTLYRVLNDVRPKNILEFGLGQSSKMIYQYQESSSDIFALSIEHDPHWIAFFRKHAGMNQNTNIQLVALEEKTRNHSTTLAYKDLVNKLPEGKFDLILLDAPFGSGRYSRSQILDLVPDFLDKSFVILLDDYNRTGEQETAEELKNLLAKNNIEFVSAVYGGQKQHLIIASVDQAFLTSI